jgi:hypothetical protein
LKIKAKTRGSPDGTDFEPFYPRLKGSDCSSRLIINIKFPEKVFLFLYLCKTLNKLKIMNTAAIRAKLQDYIRVADDKKLKAIYVMVEEEINEADPVAYTPALKSELDRRVAYYLKGGEMVTSLDMNKRLQTLRKKRK